MFGFCRMNDMLNPKKQLEGIKFKISHLCLIHES